VDTRQAVFTAVYAAEYERLRAYLHGKTTADAADDITQEAFARLWEHWDEAGEDKAAAWTWEVARNLLVDHYRRESHVVLWQWWAAPDDGWRERVEEHTDVARWWQYLTPLQQEAILMHFGEDMTYPQIALRLGVGEVALRRRAARGWEALRRRIGVSDG
jgi:RNA polymerase sigma-70 factor (ECF subfamily)